MHIDKISMQLYFHAKVIYIDLITCFRNQLSKLKQQTTMNHKTLPLKYPP